MAYLKEKLIDLTKRIYRLTLLFPKKEPLRYKMREIANEILAECLNSKIKRNPLLENFRILDSFLEIAKDQNWTSPNEILRIQNEYKKLLEELEKKIETKEINFSSSTPGELNERQKKILEILKEKGKIQVWQIKEVFPEISKRTLRRDCQNLWKKGFVERIGEKNNTFYKLK